MLVGVPRAITRRSRNLSHAHSDGTKRCAMFLCFLTSPLQQSLADPLRFAVAGSDSNRSFCRSLWNPLGASYIYKSVRYVVGITIPKAFSLLLSTPIELTKSSGGGEGCGDDRARSISWRRQYMLGSKKLSAKLKFTGHATNRDCISRIEIVSEAKHTIVHDMRHGVANL